MKTNKVLTFGAALLMCATVWGQSAMKTNSQTPVKENQPPTLTSSCGVYAQFNNGATCFGSPTYFYDSTFTDQGQNIVSWTWEFSDSLNTSTLQNPVHTFSSPGSYQVTLIVSSNTGCLDTVTQTITVSNLTLSMSGSNVSTNGGSDGSVTATTTQGVALYSFSWNNGSTSYQVSPNNSITGLAAGCYSVAISDYAGCLVTGSKCITQPSQGGCNLTVYDSIMRDADCGFNTGAAYALPNNGTGPYTYVWSNQSTTSIVTGLAPGVYTVVVTDINNCSATQTVTINASNNLPAYSYVSSNVSSFGGANGSITAYVNYGNYGAAPYSYSWSNGTTGSSTSNFTATGLTAGCYSVVITDNNGCTGTTSSCVTQPQQSGCNLNASIFSITNVTTYGGADGSISIATTGAVGDITYSWSTGGIFTNINNVGSLPAGCYTITVSDSIGCTDVVSACITQPQDSLCNVSAVISSSTNVCCFGYTDGSATVSVSGGTSPYYYSWNNGTTTQTNTGLAAGCYTVTVTDINNCTAATTVCITQPQSGAGTLNVTAENFNALSYCDSTNATSSGYAWVTNGTPPFTYLWSNGSTDWSISGLSVGCYSVVVTDANGATGTASKCVVQSSPIQFTPVVKNVNCFDSLSGEISLSGFTGGAAPFLISATNTTTNDSINGLLGSTVISNLPAGTYNVTVNDANGCQVTQLATINKANCDSVWPGDANADLVANQYDLLPIGLGYGNTGGARPNPSLNWMAQACNNWNNMQPSGIDYKHADCNGNGTIDSSDASVILVNYGQTHNKNNYSLPAGPNDPELAIVIPQDSAVGGTTVTGNIMLGTQAIPANVYGLAFSLQYDASIVKQGTVVANFSNNWIGNSSNTLTIQKDIYGSGKIDIAITRTDKQNISGSGSIGTVSFILKDDVSGKTIVYKEMNITPINVVMIDNSGVQIPINLTGDSLIASTDVTGIENVVRSSSNLIVYPNPASNVINVTAGGETMEWIRITNILGEEVYNNNAQNVTSVIDATEIPAGTYYLQVKTKGGISTRPIIVNK